MRIAPCDGIQDSFGFWIPGTVFHVFVSGTWILDINRQWDSGFLELYSEFHGPRFRNPQAKRFRIFPDSTGKNFTDSGIRIPLHCANEKLFGQKDDRPHIFYSRLTLGLLAWKTFLHIYLRDLNANRREAG